jgi:hypothetical protein
VEEEARVLVAEKPRLDARERRRLGPVQLYRTRPAGADREVLGPAADDPPVDRDESPPGEAAEATEVEVGVAGRQAAAVA